MWDWQWQLAENIMGFTGDEFPYNMAKCYTKCLRNTKLIKCAQTRSKYFGKNYLMKSLLKTKI